MTCRPSRMIRTVFSLHNKIVEDLNQAIKDYVSQWSTNCKLEMEAKAYKDGYFYMTKNYFLRSHDGEIKYKGASFKDSKNAKIMDMFRDRMALLILNQNPKEEVTAYIREAMDINQYSVDLLVKRMSVSKPIDGFKHNTKGKKLAMEYEKLTKQKHQPSNRYEYIEGNNGPMLVDFVDPENINHLEYKGALAKMAGFFGYGKEAKRIATKPGLRELKGVW